MFLVYYISVTTVGSWATDWANDGVFGDGWHLFGIGTSAYNDAADEYAPYDAEIKGFLEAAEEKARMSQKNLQKFMMTKMRRKQMSMQQSRHLHQTVQSNLLQQRLTLQEKTRTKNS